MDVSMPEMDGLEATRVIRQHEAESQLQRVPIIALSAHPWAGQRQQCLEVGMDDLVSKPFRGAELLNTIAAIAAKSI